MPMSHRMERCSERATRAGIVFQTAEPEQGRKSTGYCFSHGGARHRCGGSNRAHAVGSVATGQRIGSSHCHCLRGRTGCPHWLRLVGRQVGRSPRVSIVLLGIRDDLRCNGVVRTIPIIASGSARQSRPVKWCRSRASGRARLAPLEQRNRQTLRTYRSARTGCPRTGV
jgi:hypothetical protein